MKYKPQYRPPYQLFAFGLAAVLVAGVGVVASSPAMADTVQGQACVSDAGHLSINAKRSFGKCVGGTSLVLADVEAPDVRQTCTLSNGQDWECGRWAAYSMLELVKGKKLTCEGEDLDGNGDLIAECTVEGQDLGAQLVLFGWALARENGTRYRAEEDSARQGQRGLWQGAFLRPYLWLEANPATE